MVLCAVGRADASMCVAVRPGLTVDSPHVEVLAWTVACDADGVRR